MRTLKKLENREAPNVINISSKILKHGEKVVAGETSLFNKILQKETIPEE